VFVNKFNNQSGFTLVEIAVVLVLVGLLLGSFIGSITQRIETSQRENAKRQLDDIKTALLGFVSAQGRLPCPTTATGNGNEQPFGGSTIAIPCTRQHGFIPGKTLGISGTYNRDNLLVDVWGNPIRYSVTTNNNNAFTTRYTAPAAGGIKDVGMANLFPDLVICESDSGSDNICTAGVRTIITGTPFVILSLGKDGGDFVTNLAANSDQGENAGEALVAANAAGENTAYTVGVGNAFVSKSYSSLDSAAGLFDDLIVWESQYIIYSRMMEAGQLP
jgi:prepilin-type N-terminal cleavage/methylation domain-containing protein